MRGPLIVVALLIALAVAGCGGKELDINTSNPKPNQVKWSEPAGNEEPKGVVILLHGGGWQPNPLAYEAEMPLAEVLQKRGFATVVVGYGEGERGFREVEGIYEKVKKRYPKLPVCVHGISAGGTLGLMLAAQESGLTCVVGLVTPTDLTTIEDQGGRTVHDLAVTAFGADALSEWSPALVANQIRAQVLLLPAQTDPVVPIEQAREFVQKRPSTELYVIPDGPTPVDYLHGADTTPSGAKAAIERGFSFIEQSAGG
jgi:alpha-beta hydrolase superfamily lysophospholipase